MEILIRNSTPEAERNLEPAVLILREIMAKIVLENAIDSLAEPNFIYECIAKVKYDTIMNEILITLIFIHNIYNISL